MYTYTQMPIDLESTAAIGVPSTPALNTESGFIKAKPFMKWVGGKGQLLPQLKAHMPKQPFGRYFEPFLGGGALFFELQPKLSHINDINRNLVGAYLNIKDQPRQVVACLCALGDQYGAENEEERKRFFYEVRDRFNLEQDPNSLEKTVDLIFLNKTCFNGMYRENSKGGFNVPFGDYKNPTICNEANIMAVSKLLRGADITSIDFAAAVVDARAGDFVYFDPPYHPLNATSSFTSYSSGDFSPGDQKKLRDVFVELHKRGCSVMLSNSKTQFIEEIYDGYGFFYHTVHAGRAINSKADGRGKIEELLITNYEVADA